MIPKGLPSNNVYSIIQDRNDQIWFSTDAGVFRNGSKQGWIGTLDGVVDVFTLNAGDHELQFKAQQNEGTGPKPSLLHQTVVLIWYDHWVGKAGITLTFMLVLYLILRWFFMRKLRRDLQAARERELVNVERSRIAADVHDDLGAHVSNLLLQLRASRSEYKLDQPPELAEIDAGLMRTMEKVDEIIWSLDPNRDTALSTAEFVEKYAMDYLEHAGLELRTRIEIPKGEVLRAEVRSSVMLVAKEALRNVVDHADATVVWIDWELEQGRLIMDLSDNGVGMTGTGKSQMGNGLSNMRCRADAIGGVLSFLPGKSGEGTTVRLELDKNQNHQKW